MSRPNQPTQDGPRVNRQIRSPKIRLIDEEGNMIGVVTVSEGLRRAEEAGLDLVEISPNVDPPVCKVTDFGKLKYENQKKKTAAKKKQKVITVKEVKVRPGIEENDFQVKLRSVIKFLNEGDKVKVTLRFRGREIAHEEFGLKVLERIRDEVAEISKVEHQPKKEGRQMIMILGPK